MTDELVVPQPRLRIDRLPHAAQDLERGKIVFFREGFSEFHQCSNGGGGRVELCDFVLLDDFPEPIVGRVEGRSLEDDRRRAVQQRAVCHVRVAGDPA